MTVRYITQWIHVDTVREGPAVPRNVIVLTVGCS